MPIIYSKKLFKLGKTKKDKGSSVFTIPRGHNLDKEQEVIMMANSIIVIAKEGMDKQNIKRHFKNLMEDVDNKDLRAMARAK